MFRPPLPAFAGGVMAGRRRAPKAEGHRPAGHNWGSSNRRGRLPSGWRQIRARILERDDHVCRVCGGPASDVDHIIPGDNHDFENLQAICKPCHKTKVQLEAAEGRRKRADN